MQTGEVDAAFGTADKIVEGFFQTQVQLHHCLETHGNTVQVTPDEITCWASTQGISSVKDGLADNISMPLDKVHVMSEFHGRRLWFQIRPWNRRRTRGTVVEGGGRPSGAL